MPRRWRRRPTRRRRFDPYCSSSKAPIFSRNTFGDRIHGAIGVHDGEAVGLLQLAEHGLHRHLIFQEAVEHVARQAEVHAAFPVIQRRLFERFRCTSSSGPT